MPALAARPRRRRATASRPKKPRPPSPASLRRRRRLRRALAAFVALAAILSAGSAVAAALVRPDERVFRGDDDPMTALAVSPAGDVIATGGYGQAIRLFTPERPTCARLLATDEDDQAFTGPFLAFAPDGESLFAQHGAWIYVWNLTDGRVAARYRPEWPEDGAEERTLEAAALSPAGDRLAAGSSEGEVQVLSVADGRALFRTERSRCGRVAALAFAPDGVRLAVGHPGSAATLVLDARTGGLVCAGGAGAADVAWSPDGALVAGLSSHEVETFTSDRGLAIQRIALPNGAGQVPSLAFAPGGRLLASDGGGPRLLALDGRVVERFGNADPSPLRVAVTPFGDVVWSTGDGRLHVQPARRSPWRVYRLPVSKEP